ncbi:outer membrane porin, OprD family [Pseudomonas syringae]|nr:outer membrane porin, OprD family [Pseudomonas syringae]
MALKRCPELLGQFIGACQSREWGHVFIVPYASRFTDGEVGFDVDANLLLGVGLDSGKGRH